MFNSLGTEQFEGVIDKPDSSKERKKLIMTEQSADDQRKTAPYKKVAKF
jgi:hypothetical protein